MMCVTVVVRFLLVLVAAVILMALLSGANAMCLYGFAEQDEHWSESDAFFEPFSLILFGDNFPVHDVY